MADLNNLNAWDTVQRIPYVQPRFYPFVPVPAQTFNPYITNALELGVTTLNTYTAPPPAGIQNYYKQTAKDGNGIVLYGNAPTVGIYTGIQQE